MMSVERMAAEVKPMTEEHHDVILTQLVHLVRSMDPEGDLLCQLRSRGVLDDREIDRMRNQRSADEMNEVLLTEVLPLKSDSAFQDLVDALRASDQPHVANLLIPINTCGQFVLRNSLSHVCLSLCLFSGSRCAACILTLKLLNSAWSAALASC